MDYSRVMVNQGYRWLHQRIGSVPRYQISHINYRKPPLSSRPHPSQSQQNPLSSLISTLHPPPSILHPPSPFSNHPPSPFSNQPTNQPSTPLKSVKHPDSVDIGCCVTTRIVDRGKRGGSGAGASFVCAIIRLLYLPNFLSPSPSPMPCTAEENGNVWELSVATNDGRQCLEFINVTYSSAIEIIYYLNDMTQGLAWNNTGCQTMSSAPTV